MNGFSRFLTSTASLAALALMTGCGSDLPPIGEVSGLVTQDGKPVEGVAIEFVPVEGGRPSMAVTDSEGRYSAMYTADTDGALVGKHKIRYEVNGAAPAMPAPSDGEFIPTSKKPDMGGKNKMEPSEVEIVDGSNEINFEFIAG
ncbi:carboxypeptidase-like regulatory domain-containing protein [Rhodopirellula sp. JC740]|uniref:Carboxypeptidase-like regulatory domain-containing protein n=1 Tax=Rhodopirellula halodulae TaxID=2894198 RepID=A0ABS8NEL2_9BACT|nr:MULTISPECIES: carboxypeptidase-like regulatory domain-containing protein [unclassified Rhodopirellula]MCC9641278.1 carboxypeptidase-like regulatory domain-containing protein [Rhodopirellula sp. JC740]MCC9657686.1 carboxypeptidase-like regulatory domain-containing protein [Rhodopirellula sp. JC737]